MIHHYTLSSENYEFSVKRYENEYQLANCIDIAVYPEDGLADLRTVDYRPACSFNKWLQRGDGTVEMVKAFLSAVLRRHPMVTRVEFTDASTIRKDNTTTLLPEYMFLKKQLGKTWYEYKFEAMPMKESRRAVKLYRKAMKDLDFMKKVEVMDKWDQSVVQSLLNSYNLPLLTGSHWYIPRATVLSWGQSKLKRQQQAGGSILDKSVQSLIIRQERSLSPWYARRTSMKL